MRTITSTFKNEIKEMGRQINSWITFDDESYIDGEKIFSVKPILNTDLLKSIVKGLKFESSEEIDLDTRFKYEFGLLVDDENDTYERLNYGYYYVHERSYNEDKKIWSYTCYDKLRNSMVEYKGLQNSATFPMTVRDFITNLLDDLGITFANGSDTFTNYNRIIQEDPYVAVDENDNVSSLGYKYRDVLDELSAVVAGNLIVNNDEEAEIRYATDTYIPTMDEEFVENKDYYTYSNNEYSEYTGERTGNPSALQLYEEEIIDEEYIRDITAKFGKKFGPINTVILRRSADSDGIYKTYPADLPEENRIAIEIKDNQIMNNDDRGYYAQEILDKIKGLEFYLNDYTSTGLMYYEALDKYKIKINNYDEETGQIIETNIYNCLMLNDEPDITQGLKEKIFTELPQEAKTDYSNMTKQDSTINKIYLIVKKNEGEIESFIGEGGEFSQLVQTVEGITTNITNVNNEITEIKQTINGLEVDITKKGDNLVRNTMLWNYDGWIGNLFAPLTEGPTPPTITGSGDIIDWYCTQTSSNYENGVIYHYNYSTQVWEKTDKLRKDFNSSASEQVGVSIVQDKDNYMSYNKFVFNYDGTSETEYTGVFSELFDISTLQDTITFQFKAQMSNTSGGVNVAISLYNQDFVNRLDEDDYLVGKYNFDLYEESGLQTYKVQINLKDFLNVYANSTAPGNTSLYWLDTSSSDNILKKYNEETELWENYVFNGFLKDQNNTYYRFTIWRDTGYYDVWNGDRNVRYGQISILQDGEVQYPNLTLEVGDIKVEYGVGTDWGPRQDENYSMTHKMDALGYTISKGDNKLFLDEDEMTGYYIGNKMFYINKNEVYSQISRCIKHNVDGLITEKMIVNNETIYVRYIE